MRRWLVLGILVVLLVTVGSRLVAIQEQAWVLQQAVNASLEDGNPQVAWARVCGAEQSGCFEPSCFWWFLDTEGHCGCVPEFDLDARRSSAYAYRLGLWFEQDDNSSGAEFSYRLSLDLAPNVHAADRLTHILLQEGRERERWDIWELVVLGLPLETPDHWLARGEMAELEQDWDMATNSYGYGARLSENPYRFWSNQGRVFRRLGDLEQAAQAYQQAFLVRPLHSAPNRALGSVYLSQEKYVEAAQWLWKALQWRPEDASSHYYMARLLHEIGEDDEAVRALTQAVELHSGRPWRWLIELGDWRLALGDRLGALEAYRQASAWRPGEASIEERIEQVRED
jgi:tetratricopeptide (TPR) repeat protein